MRYKEHLSDPTSPSRIQKTLVESEALGTAVAQGSQYGVYQAPLTQSQPANRVGYSQLDPKIQAELLALRASDKQQTRQLYALRTRVRHTTLALVVLLLLQACVAAGLIVYSWG